MTVTVTWTLVLNVHDAKRQLIGTAYVQGIATQVLPRVGERIVIPHGSDLQPWSSMERLVDMSTASLPPVTNVVHVLPPSSAEAGSINVMVDVVALVSTAGGQLPQLPNWQAAAPRPTQP